MSRETSDNIREDRKGFFKYARNKMKVKERVGPIEDANGDLIYDDSLTTHILNDYVSSVFTEEDLEAKCTYFLWPVCTLGA